MNSIRDGFRLTECLDSNLERVRYFQRQLLTPLDMKDEQNYFREKQRRHNRLLHGWGTVCGLEVVPAPTDEMLWRIEIRSGYALGPYGDEIYVAAPFFLDLAQCGSGAMTDPCDPSFLRRPSSTANQQVFVAIKYAECLARPVRVMPAGCGCEEEACEYSRIRDSFQIECLTELPPSHQPSPGPTLCDIVQGRELPVCPPCPSEPWVVLAQVNLPASTGTEVTMHMIDNFTFRRQIFSTAVLQEQLIRCCCESQAAADLAVSLKPSFTRDMVGKRFVHNLFIIIINHGPSAAVNVSLISTLSILEGRLADVNFGPAGVWTNTQFQEEADSAQFTASIGNLEVGEQFSLNLTTELIFRQSAAKLKYVVKVNSDTVDPDLTNNTAEDTKGDVI